MSVAGRVALFVLVYNAALIVAFNLDIEHPTISYGPRDSLFGFSIASHLQSGVPRLLVGAPKAQSTQPGTDRSGVVFACDVSSTTSSCEPLQIEYPAGDEAARQPPDRLGSKQLHREGKNHQLLGFVVQSAGTRSGGAMVCAPLLRYGDNAYTDGACYLLRNDLNHTSVISTCGPLPKKDRHNDYGACEQGFSAYLDESVVLTGLPGARKWTGGVFGRYTFDVGGFVDNIDRWTMEVSKQQNGVVSLLASHDYLGYSVRYGRFGFWYEDESRENFTVVSGATRYNQTGAVVFLPFRKRARPEEERLLGLDESGFHLVGRQLGSGFGSAIEVLDLNGDGFDDLVVGAPYDFSLGDDRERGGAVFVYYSAGRQQVRGDEQRVFREPIVLRGGDGLHAAFGFSLTTLADVDADARGHRDFAVGAPYADGGRGVVFVFHGAEPNRFSTTAAQTIYARQLTTTKSDGDDSSSSLRAFGGALSGGVDLDDNGYPDLAVGAFASDTAIVLRARPVVDVQLDHTLTQRYIRINGDSSCPSNYRTCFTIQTSLSTIKRRDADADPTSGGDEPYTCELSIVATTQTANGHVKAVSGGSPSRAVFATSRTSSVSWPCGRGSARSAQRREHQVLVPYINQDWVSPIGFNFTAYMNTRARRDLAPVIRNSFAAHSFDAIFDRKCGQDNNCNTDLAVKPVLLNMTRTANGTYTSKVTERDSIVVRFLVENRAERAYLAKLFVIYNADELDVPQLTSGGATTAGVDIERNEAGVAVVALGNPLEEGAKLTFDMRFNLVRGSSERVSAELVFEALVNSTSLEEYADDNTWRAEVKLIKQSELELIGTSRPAIVRFSKGNRQTRILDEEDIGPQVVHAYTVTNHGPFYAKNVTLRINWPLKVNTRDGDGEWALYTLEAPMVRHRDEIRKCTMAVGEGEMKSINPLNIYNDETHTLAYSTHGLLKQSRERRSTSNKTTRSTTVETTTPTQQRLSSIFDSDYIKTKDVVESSGARVRTIDINCKDQSAICVPLICTFDYLGTGESALIEIRARLWNYTFSNDYQRIEYIAITSNGVIEIDPQQGIIENYANNFASATTHAYPDRPLQQDKLQLWIIILAVLVGLALLALLVLCAHRCGFFKRKRPHLKMLHQAEYTMDREMYSGPRRTTTRSETLLNGHNR